MCKNADSAAENLTWNPVFATLGKLINSDPHTPYWPDGENRTIYFTGNETIEGIVSGKQKMHAPLESNESIFHKSL